MFALSSLVFAHHGVLDWMYDGRDVSEEGDGNWKSRFSKQYDGGLDLNADQTAREAFARHVLDEHDLACSRWVSPVQNGMISVGCFKFLSHTRVTYDVQAGLLHVEERRFRWDNFLTGLHARGGFRQDGALNLIWAVIVDLVCMGFIIWAATGLYMWWNQPRLRRWGLVTLVAGFATFLGFMFGL